MFCYKAELLANDILSTANAPYGIVYGSAAHLLQYAFLWSAVQIVLG